MEPRELIWLEIMKFYGLAEIPGEVDNAFIVGWFKEIGYSEIKDDETAWCSLLINIACKRTEMPYTGKLNARSWLEIGKQTIMPRIGDIAVFYRGSRNGWQGHVGLYAGVSDDKKIIFTLGGNQNNKICIAGYPKESDTYGLLGFREISF